MKVYCPYCKKEVEYKIEKRELKEFRGIEVNTFENVAICNECNQDLYVNEIEDVNNERIYQIYREKANIIKAEDIIKLRGVTFSLLVTFGRIRLQSPTSIRRMSGLNR